MHEQTKALRRRITQPAFMLRYFAGDGLDIGAGDDGLSRYISDLPRVRSVRDWDVQDGDAQYLSGVPEASVDFVHSSHCLEHLLDPQTALVNWLRVIRPGGHLIVTVPEENMYEHGVWPSRYNPDHKWTFSASSYNSWSPKAIALVDLAASLAPYADLERLDVLRDFYRPDDPRDQTLGPLAECAIEVVWRRTNRRTGEPFLTQPAAKLFTCA